MALTREQKQKVVEDLKEKIDRQKSIIFVAVDGLNVADLFDLRRRLGEDDCLLKVVKKTLLRIVLKEKNIKVDEEKLKGEIALVFGFGDEIPSAKIPYNFSLENKNLKILGGVFENKFIDKERVVELAKIPTKEELLARVVGSIRAPLANFANVLQGNIKGLMYILKQIKA